MRRPPFVWTTSVPDSDPSRFYFGKSFIYSVFAAPFVRLFGTNGFLVLHALLLGLVAWCSYVFLHARMSAASAVILAGAFLLASVVPVYFVWITPELFIFSLGLLAYFCWLYKEVATPEQAPARHALAVRQRERPRRVAASRHRYLFKGDERVALSSDRAVAALAPAMAARGAQHASSSCSVAGGLFAINTAISGEWNYQGGADRSTFYHEFPLQTPGSTFAVGTEKERNESLTEIIFDRRVFATNLLHNLGYFFVGRYSGLLPYFFPGLFALASLRRWIPPQAGLAVTSSSPRSLRRC